MKSNLTRRDFLRIGGMGLLGAGGLTAAARKTDFARGKPSPPVQEIHHGDGAMPGTGDVDIEKNGFDPAEVLTDFDYGTVSTMADGRTLREYKLTVINKIIEVLPGIEFPAWTYNGRIPGPTLRCTEGDLLRITMINGSNHPHTVHFHGIHPAAMDGVPGTGPGGSIEPGGSFTYEFDAAPFGVHLYHCHVFPLARHIAKGLYGAFIVDPRGGRPRVDREMVMVMSGFDVDFDDVNDFYAVNGIPFYYQNHPIPLRVGEQVRIYLVNILEFDPLNSFHLHANFFQYYPTGTSLTPSEFTDTVIQGQAQRGILEFSYRHPGMYMFHAHVTEFAELGWNGMFAVTE